MRKLVAFMAVPLLLACNDEETTEPIEGAQVQATNDLRFSPIVTEIEVGERVTFVFQSTAHTVTFDDVAGRPEDIPQSANTQEFRIFPVAGTFTFSCSIHPTMTGQIIVSPPASTR